MVWQLHLYSCIQTPSKIRELYSNRLKMSPYVYTDTSSVAYDAVWALAIALNKTANQCKITNTCCDTNWTARSVATESLIEQYLEETDFYGFSVSALSTHLQHLRIIAPSLRVVCYLIAMGNAYTMEFTSTNLDLVCS